MSSNDKEVYSVLSIKKIWIPILIGIIATLYVIKVQKEFLSLEDVAIDSRHMYGVACAFLFMVLRDFAFVARLRVLVDGKIGWLAGLYIIMLWDFSSAVTPSVAGGGVVAIFLIVREGVKFGKALAAIILATIADNLFFIAISPIAFFSSKTSSLSQIDDANIVNSAGKYIFIIGFLIVFVYTLIVIASLWWNPRFLKWVLLKLCMKIKFLRKWRYSAVQHGNDLILASKEFKNKSKKFWILLTLFTISAVMCRYFVLNSLISSIVALNFFDHIKIIGNQVLLWIVMLISITPGSAGTAEFFFTEFFESILCENLLIIELLWRFLTYYIHIFLGAILIIRHIRRSSLSKKNKNAR